MIFQFSGCSLDTELFELRRRGQLVGLEPQVFRLIVYLIQNCDRVVKKDELVEKIWDGRIVSDSVLNTRINSARNALGDNGKAQSVIRTFSRRGFRFVAEVVETQSGFSAPTGSQIPLPDRPSIAVLPFSNISGDPDQEYFADGLAEDIISGLSKFHWFFVIARNSSFTYKGSAVDVKQVGRELGVRYVLEGGVRKAGSRVRITAQLIDAQMGHHVWAGRYDRDFGDIFAVQDELTESIVGAVAPSFIVAETMRIERKPPGSLDSWDYAIRGNWHLWRLNKEGVAEARRLFDRALEVDPKNTMALSGIAFTLGFSINFGWVDDLDEARRLGHDVAQRAVGLDGNNAGAYLALALISFYSNDLDAAVDACRHALDLNPNLAAAEGWLAIVLSWRGDYDEAIVHAERSSRLSPRDNHSMWSLSQTTANFGAGNYERCVDWARKVIGVTPEFPIPWRYLVAGLAHLGRLDEARAAKDQLLRIMPNENLRLVRAALPSANADRMQRFAEGLRKAGVPE
jgi:TolB-like protein